ncbi:hypothetical protein PAXINDRAFT_92146, partial [Paxillus involutus ATCC 200175]
MNCGKENLILGLPWLREVNPVVDWQEGTLTFPDRPKKPRHDSQDQIAQRYLIRYLEFRKTTISSEIAQEAEKKKEKATLPPEYSEFSEIFEKKATDHVPPSRSFDHAIDL